MVDKKQKDYSVHVHFHGTPTPEFMEAFDRMVEVAAKMVGTEINNENTEKRVGSCDDCMYRSHSAMREPCNTCGDGENYKQLS